MSGHARYKEFEQEEQLERIRQLVADGKSDKQVAIAIGVTPQLLSRWRKRSASIRDALTRYTTIDGKMVDRHDLCRGKPRKIDNVTRLQAKVEAWLEECKREDIPPTRSGLCLALGISKDTLSRYLTDTTGDTTVYQADPITGELHPVTFADVLKRAILAIEHSLEIRMLTSKSNVAGVIFDLKNNHGYADKSETVSTQTVTKLTNADDIDARIKELLERQEQAKPFLNHTKSG